MPSAADVLGDDRLRFVLNARPDLLEPLRAALRRELGDDVAGAPRCPRPRRAVDARGAAAGDRRRLLHGSPGPGADRLSRADGARAPLVGVPGLSRGRADRRRARSRADVARPGDRAAGRRRRRPADLRGAIRGRRSRRRPKEDRMAAIAPDQTESAAPGWLGSFVETWEPGTGAPIEDREPATGRLIATVPGSTPDDVARAAAAAKAAQPAWAETSLPGASPRSCAARPRSTRRTATSSAPGPARDRRLAQQDAPRVELRLPARSSTRRRCRRSRTAR